MSGLTRLKTAMRRAGEAGPDKTGGLTLTPYLALVLAGFTVFVVVLGVVTLQGWMAALKARRPAVRDVQARAPSGAHSRQGAH